MQTDDTFHRNRSIENHPFAKSVAYAILCLGIGAVFAFSLFDTDMLLDRWSWWASASGDNANSAVGYLFFAQDEWRWPLLHTVKLEPPDGVNIIFTDPIPIAAIIGKVLYQLTGDLQTYVGRWTLLCFSLQPLLGWLIFRQIGLSRVNSVLAASLLLLLPALTFRYHHVGLMAHFVILMAILFYIRNITVATNAEIATSSVLIGAVALFNPYLLAMSSAVYFGGLADAAWRGRLRWWQAGANMVLCLTVAAGLAYALGIIGHSPVPPTGGFGFFSMNILSPVTPQFSVIPGFSDYLLNPNGGQYEGFNYLGAGILLLVASAAIALMRSERGQSLQFPFLGVALLGLTLFAISDNVYFGPFHVVDLRYQHLPVIELATSAFRSSGRFFWPVSYVLVIAAVCIWAARLSGRHLAALLAVAVLIQLADISPLIGRTRAENGPPKDHIDRPVWSAAIDAHSEVTIYPDYYCAERKHLDVYTQLHFLAARRNKPINAAYVNRKFVNCEDRPFLSELDARSVSENPLVIVFKEAISVSQLRASAGARFACRETERAYVCSANAGLPAFVEMGPLVFGVSP